MNVRVQARLSVFDPGIVIAETSVWEGRQEDVHRGKGSSELTQISYSTGKLVQVVTTVSCEGDWDRVEG